MRRSHSGPGTQPESMNTTTSPEDCATPTLRCSGIVAFLPRGSNAIQRTWLSSTRCGVPGVASTTRTSLAPGYCRDSSRRFSTVTATSGSSLVMVTIDTDGKCADVDILSSLI